MLSRSERTLVHGRAGQLRRVVEHCGDQLRSSSVRGEEETYSDLYRATYCQPRRRLEVRRITTFTLKKRKEGEKRRWVEETGKIESCGKRTLNIQQLHFSTFSPRLDRSLYFQPSSSTYLVAYLARGLYHHGRCRGRLGLCLQDGDGRRVDIRVYQDEDLVARQ